MKYNYTETNSCIMRNHFGYPINEEGIKNWMTWKSYKGKLTNKNCLFEDFIKVEKLK